MAERGVGGELIFNWNAEAAPPLRHVEVEDETLRDGLQSYSVKHPDLPTKRRCLRMMAELGVQRVNLGLPMASQIDDIRGLLETLGAESLPLKPGVAVRSDIADIATVAALRESFPGIDLRANVFLGASAIRCWAENWSWTKVLEMASASVSWATERGVPVMFVTEDTTRSRPEHLAELYTVAIEAGAKEICIADTVGHILPEGVTRLVAAIRAVTDATTTPNVKINWHGHSDRGMALANTLAAIRAGVDVVHGTVLGIGERSGNTQLEQLLVNLHLEGVWHQPLTRLGDYVQTITESTGAMIPAGYPMFGSDAFRTATGVHAAAIAKAQEEGATDIADLVYSAVPASLVGRHQEIGIGPLAGHWCVNAWLDRRRVPRDAALTARLIQEGQQRGRVLEDAEIQAIVDAHSAAS